jgi:hypothetical protein
MENKIVTRNLRRELNQAIIHEQVENAIAINKNLNADQINHELITTKMGFKSK